MGSCHAHWLKTRAVTHMCFCAAQAGSELEPGSTEPVGWLVIALFFTLFSMHFKLS